MNDWLVKILQDYGCREIVVVQPTERAKQKTDHRDAGELAHLLWVHRQQFLGRESTPWACGACSGPRPKRPKTGS